ncbi:MAG: hypothetical protein MI863_15250 [Desulfobacterales bacterium]|nr:hypothetical protein [Desulfobacterales bacterium]
MLGFLKKKNKEEDPKSQDDKAKTAGKEAPDAEQGQPAPKRKGVAGLIKKLVFIVLILGAVGGAGFFVYTTYFAEPDPNMRVYKPVTLAHVNLPPEMLKFSFDKFPVFYEALVAYNEEVNLFDGEIARIEAIGDQYPEQKKIADSQKKVWEKGKNTLIKGFAKLEKPVKETYVLYQVNPAQGEARIAERTGDLTSTAEAAVTAAREQTAVLKARAPEAPEGIIQGTIDKIKKIFL